MTATPPSPDTDASVPERTLLTRVRRMLSLIPTPWLITAGGAIVLAMTAGFGGLADAPVKPVPTVTVGQQFTGGDLTMTVQNVELLSDRGSTALFPKEEKGEMVLAVTVDVVNTFSSPRSAVSGLSLSPVVDGIRIEGVDGKPTVSRTDRSDGTMLQPDVPARLVVAWMVHRGDFHDGDTVHLTLPGATHFVGTNVLKGQDYWSDVVVGATLKTTVTEIPPAADGSTL